MATKPSLPLFAARGVAAALQNIPHVGGYLAPGAGILFPAFPLRTPMPKSTAVPAKADAGETLTGSVAQKGDAGQAHPPKQPRK